MEEEAVRGPVGLIDDEDVKNKDDCTDTSDDDNKIDNEKLRSYELSRLRYYFAVVVCKSIATAKKLYKSCNGIEFQRSSNILDLRFIPDSMEFKRPRREVATEESEYAKVEQRYKEFIAPSESDTGEDENNIINHGKRQKIDKYRALLQSGPNSDEDEEDNNRMEMEVTFNTGLEDRINRIPEQKDKKSETVWDACLQKKKEKKKARKSQSMDSDREPVEESGGFFAGDSDKKGKKCKKEEMGGRKEGEASKAELELLLDDDDSNHEKGYSLKRKKSKGKKVKKEGMDKIPSVADFDDLRFSSDLTRPDYALDPTDPQFKRSAANVRQVAHKQNKGDLERKGGANSGFRITSG